MRLIDTHSHLYEPKFDAYRDEALGELTGLNPGELATLLVGLELAGAVRQLPGNRYMKL